MTSENFWALADQTGGPESCWNWLGSLNGGNRGRVKHDGRYQYAYRVAVELATGTIVPSHLLVCHHCDNPQCVNPSHLYIGTQKQNMRDAINRGRLAPPKPQSGESQWLAYPDAVVDQARRRYSNGEKQKDLAAELGVSLSQVRRWVSGGDRGRRPIRRTSGPCGTRGGYFAHLRKGEATCEPCKGAHTAYMRAYKASRRLAVESQVRAA